MTKVNFKNGVLKLNIGDVENKQTAIFLAFSQANMNHHIFDAMQEALPRKHGLRRKSYRAEYAFDIIQNLEKQGYEITRKKSADQSP